MKHKKKKDVRWEYIFGVNPIQEAINAGRRKISGIIVKKGATGKPVLSLISHAKRCNIPVDFSSIDKIARLADAEGHQGIVALVTMPRLTDFDKLVERAISKPKSGRPTLCLLDGVMDPRNLGAIIRSANAFGLDGVIYPAKRAASYTPVAAKASAGAGEHMSLCPVNNIAECVRKLRDDGFHCVALDAGGTEELDFAGISALALVLGSEGKGIRPLVIKRCDKVMKIPITGPVGSLNVSSAAAVTFHMASSR
ncbi:23S rRNA (guanosine(2251)-2'-O)-methyltransferase [hydrothermal vent metagenome]|uniref:23S rRNA (Guanosine(2251)-2'-O)-methyltransferase n=1 Tax=hydrothermal vent metagenome TaxID=652676 RepID=A0A3B1C658_9ZZZZ